MSCGRNRDDHRRDSSRHSHRRRSRSASRSRSRSPRRRRRDDHGGDDEFNSNSRWNFGSRSHRVLINRLDTCDSVAQLMECTKHFDAIDVQFVVDPRSAPPVVEPTETDPAGSGGGSALITFASVSHARRFVEGRESGEPGVFTLEGRDLPIDYYHPPLTASGEKPADDGPRKRDGPPKFLPNSSAIEALASGVRFDDIGEALTDRVALAQNLPPHSSEAAIRHAFAALATVRDVNLLRDPVTNIASGVAFVEFESIEDAARVVSHIQQCKDSHPICIEGRPIGAQLVRDVPHLRPPPPGAAGVAGGAAAVQKFREQAMAVANASNASKRSHDSRQDSRQDRHERHDRTERQDSTHALDSVDHSSFAAASAHSAMAYANPAMAYAAQMSQMAAPPSSSFVYDPNSGYYYDASSGYFFHPQTQLYFHSQTQQYYRWDDATKQYAVVSSTSADQASSLPSESDQKTELNSNELELFPKKTSKLAAPVKFNIKATAPVPARPVVEPRIALEAEELPAVEHSAPPVPVNAPTPLAQSKLSADGHLDFGRLLCLLCRRQFVTLDKVQVHAAQSELHRFNLTKHNDIEKLRAQSQAHQQRVAQAIRRETSELQRLAGGGTEDDEPRRRERRHSPVHATASVNRPIYASESSNIGSKMMKNMGWAEGQGLGSKASGMVNPLAPDVYTKGAGLGSANKDSFEKASSGGLSYREAARLKFSQRFADAMK